MNAKWTPTLAERMFLSAYDVIGQLAVGYSSRVVNTELVRTMGLRGALHHLRTTMKVVGELQDAFGHHTAQYLVGLSSLFIGCGFCTYNHILAGALIWFRDEGSLHPLDPHFVSRLFELRDKEIDQELRATLTAPEHQRLLELTLRMHALYLEEVEPETDDDALLEACLWIWRWTTECSIVEGITFAPEDAHPLHAVGRDRKLRERYELAKTEANAD